MITTLSMEAWITLAVLLAVLYFLMRSDRAPDAILWCGLAILMMVPVRKDGNWELGVMSAGDALSGLANEGVVTIAAMFAVAAGLKETGALRWLSYKLMGAPKSLTSAQNRVMWPTATISAFMNNTPLVAMLLPIIDEWSKQHRLSASKLLMPLSFASILGGTCTLIGTSTNLVVNGWIIEELNHPGLGMFEITIIGLPAYRQVHFDKRKADPVESLACARFAIVERPDATPHNPLRGGEGAGRTVRRDRGRRGGSRAPRGATGRPGDLRRLGRRRAGGTLARGGGSARARRFAYGALGGTGGEARVEALSHPPVLAPFANGPSRRRSSSAVIKR